MVNISKSLCLESTVQDANEQVWVHVLQLGLQHVLAKFFCANANFEKL
jgi:hypothetical protein